MPQDATWRPNRHHSNIIPLFRNHVTQNAVAMFPPPPNPVASTEHGCPHSPLPAVGDAWVLGDAGSSHHDDAPSPPPVPQNLKTLLRKQQTQAVNDRIPAKGWRHLLVKPLANGKGKGNTCQLCGAITNDKGEITGTCKSIQRKLVTDEGKRHSSRTVLGLLQDEVDEAKRLLEEANVEVQAAQNKGTEAAFRVGLAMEEMSQIRKLLEANSEPADQ